MDEDMIEDVEVRRGDHQVAHRMDHHEDQDASCVVETASCQLATGLAVGGDLKIEHEDLGLAADLEERTFSQNQPIVASILRPTLAWQDLPPFDPSSCGVCQSVLVIQGRSSTRRTCISHHTLHQLGNTETQKIVER